MSILAKACKTNTSLFVTVHDRVVERVLVRFDAQPEAIALPQNKICVFRYVFPITPQQALVDLGERDTAP